MVYCHGQALFRTEVSEVMQEMLISDRSNGDYTRVTCRVGLIHPFFHLQSKVGKFASTKQYHMVFINGTEEHYGYNDGFMNYEALFEQIVNKLSSAFPSSCVPHIAPRRDSLIVALICVEECGDPTLLSMSLCRWDQQRREHELVCGLTLISQVNRSNSKTLFRLPGSQSTSLHSKGMFLLVLHSLQLWIAYRSDFDKRPLENMWSMSILSPKDCVLYFADHGYYLDNSAQAGDKVVRMRLEDPMTVSAGEGGVVMMPDNTKNDLFCCKIIALQKLGVTAWEEDKQDTTLSVLMLCIQRSSLFNQKVRVGEGASFKENYFLRCDYCNKKATSIKF
jgi:hypothetical protein